MWLCSTCIENEIATTGFSTRTEALYHAAELIHEEIKTERCPDHIADDLYFLLTTGEYEECVRLCNLHIYPINIDFVHHQMQDKPIF